MHEELKARLATGRALAKSQSESIADALKHVAPMVRPALDKILEYCPKHMQKLLITAVSGKASPRAAIKAHCLECVGWSRPDVISCTSPACPLFKYRPFQPKAKKTSE